MFVTAGLCIPNKAEAHSLVFITVLQGGGKPIGGTIITLGPPHIITLVPPALQYTSERRRPLHFAPGGKLEESRSRDQSQVPVVL
jgi:hypothetical protein